MPSSQTPEVPSRTLRTPHSATWERVFNQKRWRFTTWAPIGHPNAANLHGWCQVPKMVHCGLQDWADSSPSYKQVIQKHRQCSPTTMPNISPALLCIYAKGVGPTGEATTYAPSKQKGSFLSAAVITEDSSCVSLHSPLLTCEAHLAIALCQSILATP
jgi:hypothetical protein